MFVPKDILWIDKAVVCLREKAYRKSFKRSFKKKCPDDSREFRTILRRDWKGSVLEEWIIKRGDE